MCKKNQLVNLFWLYLYSSSNNVSTFTKETFGTNTSSADSQVLIVQTVDYLLSTNREVIVNCLISNSQCDEKLCHETMNSVFIHEVADSFAAVR